MERWERYAPLTGIVAVVLWIVGQTLVESPDRPAGTADAEAFLGWVQENDASLLAGGILFAFGSLFFLWFLGSLRAALYTAEGAPGRLSSIAFAAGALVAFSTLGVVAPIVQAAIEQDDVTGDTVRTLVLVADMFFGGIELFSIPMLAATALVILRAALFARWVAWASLLLALVMVVIPIGWLGVIFGLPLWTILMSVLLYRLPSPAPVQRV